MGETELVNQPEAGSEGLQVENRNGISLNGEAMDVEPG